MTTNDSTHLEFQDLAETSIGFQYVISCALCTKHEHNPNEVWSRLNTNLTLPVTPRHQDLLAQCANSTSIGHGNRSSWLTNFFSNRLRVPFHLFENVIISHLSP